MGLSIKHTTCNYPENGQPTCNNDGELVFVYDACSSSENIKVYIDDVEQTNVNPITVGNKKSFSLKRNDLAPGAYIIRIQIDKNGDDTYDCVKSETFVIECNCQKFECPPCNCPECPACPECPPSVINNTCPPPVVNCPPCPSCPPCPTIPPCPPCPDCAPVINVPLNDCPCSIQGQLIKNGSNVSLSGFNGCQNPTYFWWILNQDYVCQGQNGAAYFTANNVSTINLNDFGSGGHTFDIFLRVSCGTNCNRILYLTTSL
jgi:hypothetical protein